MDSLMILEKRNEKMSLANTAGSKMLLRLQRAWSSYLQKSVDVYKTPARIIFAPPPRRAWPNDLHLRPKPIEQALFEEKCISYMKGDMFWENLKN